MLGDLADDFLASGFEQGPVIVRHNDPQRFAKLLSIARIDRIVTGHDLREGSLALANATADVRDEYVAPSGAIDRAVVADAYRKGATIILNHLHQSDNTLATFCRALEKIFSCHVQTNVYLTPPDSQGFRTHYDNHDVFILQIEGEKSWRLYDQVDSPYRGEGFVRRFKEAEAPSDTFVLKAGDCAYIPRGLTHDAIASGDAPSLHVTCGLIVRTWAELMLEAVSEICVEEPAFRKALPPGFASPDFDPAEANKTFAALVELIAKRARPDAAFDLMIDALIRSREPNVTGAILRAPFPLTGAWRARQGMWRMEPDGDLICLVAAAGDYRFEPALRPFVEKALSGEVIDIDTLGDPERTVIERLAARGLIGPA